MSDKKSGKRRLYKNPDNAKICGVCSGLAEYFGFEVWVVRIIAVSLLLLSWFSGTVFLAYLVLCFVLDPKPGSKKTKGPFTKERPQYHSSPDEAATRPYRSSVKEVWKTGASPKQMLDLVEDKFTSLEDKLQGIESFVTSSQFELEKEFNKMAD